MKTRIKHRLIVALFGLGGTLAGAAQADLAIVVNPEYSGSNITLNQVRDLYHGKRKTLPNGERAKMVDQPSGSGPRSQFLSTVLGQSESQLNRYWSKLIFSGKGRPPEILESSAAVKLWVALNPEGIGYIDSDDVDATIKVLLKVYQ